MILLDCQAATHNMRINLPPMMSCPGFIGGKFILAVSLSRPRRWIVWLRAGRSGGFLAERCIYHIPAQAGSNNDAGRCSQRGI